MTPVSSASTEQIFLSYSRTDREAALQLRAVLQQAGFSVFQDDQSIRSGDNWMSRLDAALKGCTAFVVLVGRDGVTRWVMAETQIALIRHYGPHDAEQRLPVFPVLLPEGDVTNLPPFLSLLQIQRWQAGEVLPDSFVPALLARTEPLDVRQSVEGCPYLGLGAFQSKDAHLFFGRRTETLQALACLGAQQASDPEQVIAQDGLYHRWLQIEGNSGAGKSSLVNAGMLPLIRQGALWSRTGYEHWQVIGPMMPGEKPLQKLAEVLEHSLVGDPERRDIVQRYQALQHNDQALALHLRGFKEEGNAFLLVVDQFEELFTFADKAERLAFDRQVYHALIDKDCPLFLLTTVRIDFLEGFEQLPCLSELYNRYCKGYRLQTISQDGLREAIEQPARLAGLEVGEVTAMMLKDAHDEPGALPLVENALRVLWEARQGNRLSGQLYVDRGGMAGLLEEQADALLARLEQALPNGRKDALELLLALTRVNDEGRHTRRRLGLGEARQAAGGKKADPVRGQRVIDFLTGGVRPEGNGAGSLRVLTTDKDSVDLIHETLIRAKSKDAATGKLVGYWKTLYDYIEQNRERGFYRDQLTRQAERWQASRGLFGRWKALAGWADVRHYRPLRPERGSVDERFLRKSRWMKLIEAGALAVVAAFVLESYLWTTNNGMPQSYMLTQQKFRLMDWGVLPLPLPAMSDEILPPEHEFRVGEYDDGFGRASVEQLGGGLGGNNFGYPSAVGEIKQPFAIGKYEVTYEQYDYFVWQQKETGEPILGYPSGAVGDNGRGQRAVTNVSWNDANVYLKWLSDATGDDYRLPTEVEWEYAARAGTESAYWWGNEAGQGNANCAGCGSEWDNARVAPVGSFQSNPWSLYDTAGNVWEWTCSEWKQDFDGSESVCMEPENQAGARVLRGGSWNLTTVWLRSSARLWNLAAYRLNNVGFRVYRAARTR